MTRTARLGALSGRAARAVMSAQEQPNIPGRLTGLGRFRVTRAVVETLCFKTIERPPALGAFRETTLTQADAWRSCRCC